MDELASLIRTITGSADKLVIDEATRRLATRWGVFTVDVKGILAAIHRMNAANKCTGIPEYELFYCPHFYELDALAFFAIGIDNVTMLMSLNFIKSAFIYNRVRVYACIAGAYNVLTWLLTFTEERFTVKSTDARKICPYVDIIDCACMDRCIDETKVARIVEDYFPAEFEDIWVHEQAFATMKKFKHENIYKARTDTILAKCREAHLAECSGTITEVITRCTTPDELMSYGGIDSLVAELMSGIKKIPSYNNSEFFLIMNTTEIAYMTAEKFLGCL